MNTKVLIPNDENLKTAAQIIRDGGLVAFPTETVYGLGVNALLEDGAPRVYAAKGRPSDNPLIIHIFDPAEAEKYCYTTDMYYRVSKKFMPGPVTYILPKKEIIPDCVTGSLDTVAVRVPSNPVARELIKLSGVPIAAPSANLSGRPSTTTADHCIADLYGKIEAIIDGGECDIGLESTILTEKNGSLVILRPGGVTVEMLEAEGFSVTLDKAVVEKLGADEKPLAPGMKYRHYAPNAQVTLLDGTPEKVLAYMENAIKCDDTRVICFEEDTNLSSDERSIVIGSRADRLAYAHNLFAVLRELDDEPEIKKVLAMLPSTDGIGLAIFNRLLKASGYNILNLD